MRILCAVLLAALVGAGFWLRLEVGINRTQIAQIQQLTQQLADKSKRENFELQQQCSADARQRFRSLGYSEAGEQPEGILAAGYESHYNAAQNRCFMSLSLMMTKGMETLSLFDAVENRTYADYSMSQSNGEQHIFICQLTPLAEQSHDCKSEVEYKAFVTRYME